MEQNKVKGTDSRNLEQEERTIGRWGRMRRTYLQEEHPDVFRSLMRSGKLRAELEDLNEQAQDRLDQIVDQMKAAEGITEALKARDMMAWVRAMNSIRARAEEIILAELIYA